MHHGWTEVRCFGRFREVHTLARYSIGDYQDHFSIQSTSKPFTYALSLDELGIDMIKNFIGREPSGGNFNEITLDYNGEKRVIN